MKQNLEVHFWGFQGQKRDYSPCIWNVDVLKNSSFKGRLPHDNRSYKDVIPKGLSWRFDSSESEFAITCLQMIQLKERPQDFFAGTLVFPRGTSVTDDQLQQLQSQVTKAVEVLTRVVTTMRPDEMGPIHGEARNVAPRELLKASHECIILPLDSGYTLGGMVKKLTELHHNQLTVLLLDPANGEPASQEEMQTVIRVASSSHPEATISIAANLEEVQQEDAHQYQELLNERAEKQRLAEEKRQQEDARLAKEARRREEDKRQRQARKARTLALLKTAAKGLAVLGILGGIGVGGYLIKDDVMGVINKTKNAIAGLSDDTAQHKTIDQIGPTVQLQKPSAQDSTHVITWSETIAYLEQQFQFDTKFNPDLFVLVEESGFPDGVKLKVHEGDSALHGLAIQIDAESGSLRLVETLLLSTDNLPGLPVSSLVIVLKKDEDMEGVAPEDDLEPETLPLEQDSTSTDTSMTPENTP